TAVAAFALLAMLVRTLVVAREVSGRYRPAIAASLGVLTVAFLSYVLIAVQFAAQYRWNGSGWVPGPDAVLAWAIRYMDWSVTVPLLVVELVAVSALRGAAIARTRAVGIAAAFLMIATGYIGGVAVDDGQNRAALIAWGVVSAVFFAAVYAVVLATVLRSLPAMPSSARRPYRTAMVVLMVTWFVYPVVFGLQGATSGGTWAVVGQLLLCAADVVAKVLFGVLIHKTAKMRTAFDAQTGLNRHAETLWLDGSRISDAVVPPSAAPGGAADAPLDLATPAAPE
ncbi:MAG: bacteriorhodopsin, partial [Amnibacterium sp.]